LNIYRGGTEGPWTDGKLYLFKRGDSEAAAEKYATNRTARLKLAFKEGDGI